MTMGMTHYTFNRSRAATIASGLFNRFAGIGAIIWRRAEAKLVMQAETPDPQVCLCGGARVSLRFANRSRRVFERIRREWVWFLFRSVAAPYHAMCGEVRYNTNWLCERFMLSGSPLHANYTHTSHCHRHMQRT